MATNQKKIKVVWLGGFIVLVLMMISIGGITRLTRSGLSIVEWKPVSGLIPPLSESEWQYQFSLYQKTPEFTQVNSSFGVSDYKRIFIWEYLHRVLGRLIFLFVVVPGIFLWRRKLVSGRLVLSLASLVALQGLVGWLMVKSGLNTRPHVSPYMLALHFFFALSVMVYAYYFLCRSQSENFETVEKKNWRWIQFLGVFLLLQIFYGCLTSGLKAGFSFNTYPLMGGSFFPTGGFVLEPGWLNIFENPATIQWIHRWLGALTLLTLVGATLSIFRSHSARLRGPFFHFLGITGLQVFLGILNIVLVVPIYLAVIHQLVAALLVLAYFNILFRVQVRR